MSKLIAVRFGLEKVEQTRVDEAGNESLVLDYPSQLCCDGEVTNCPDYTSIERAIVAGVYGDDTHTRYYAHGLPVVEGVVTIPVLNDAIAPYFEGYLTKHPECGVWESEVEESSIF